MVHAKHAVIATTVSAQTAVETVPQDIFFMLNNVILHAQISLQSKIIQARHAQFVILHA